MRIFAATLIALLAAPALSAAPLEAGDSRKDVIAEQPDNKSNPKQVIDQLYQTLKRERDADKAAGIATQIRTQLDESGSPTVDLLMQWADKAMQEKRIPAALDFLDQAIALKPNYTGSWNRRATLNFTTGSYRRSMADIEQILILEPRHIGALAGMAAILEASDKDKLALAAWQRYLDIYPADRAAQEQANTLAEKLAGNPT